jgi:Protein of unknown function (DUF2950)
MNLHATRTGRWDICTLAMLLLCLAAGIVGCSKQKPAVTSKSAVTSEGVTQVTFATPDKAGQALQVASATEDENALLRILGSRSQAILSSGDPAEDQSALKSFVTKYNRMHRWVAMSNGSRVLYIGSDNYPFPIPLTQNASQNWYFDTKAGEEEVLARRIGRNELLAIDACRSIANAEEVYFQSPHDASPAQQYTQNIISHPGTQDGLYWEVGKDAPASPLGNVKEFVNEPLSPPSANNPPIFDGYTFRILTAQGQDAKGGSKNYLVDGKLKNGFAIIAAPTKYQDSGIMTFILSRAGVVYQKDLGEKTVSSAASIQSYNPAHGWDVAD